MRRPIAAKDGRILVTRNLGETAERKDDASADVERILLLDSAS
jgi:hypothetical protein